jgi:DNA-binding NtrC family response regulator
MVGDLPAFEGLVGDSPAMRALFARLARVAAVDVPVLILGETGTGKELVAAALHRLSRRRTARFEPVNCGGLTPELLRSELFGHERGAFTGAVERRPGLIPAADGGTVFLDEVGELAAPAQAMLLRFLAEGEVRPVGATRTTRVDVRVIAATHRDLLVCARAGGFREDLYYRLRRAVVRVPPLRERREDLPLLVEQIRRQVNQRHGLAIEPLAPALLRRLAAHPWPGNVRELEAVLEEAMVLVNRGPLALDGLALDEAPRSRSERPAPDRQALALRLAAERGAVTRRELAAAGDMSGERARQELQRLVQQGRLRRVGAGRSIHYVMTGGGPR